MSFTQEPLWPESAPNVPPWLRRLRHGVLLYFKNNPNAWKAPTHLQISQALEKDSGNGWFSLANVYRYFRRAREQCPESWPWPQHRGARLWWEDEPPLIGIVDDEPVTPQPSDQLEMPLADGRTAVVEVGNDGLVRVRAILTVAATSMVTVYSVLDGMDGQRDMVIHWCRVFIQYGFGHL